MTHYRQFTIEPANRAWTLLCGLVLALAALFSMPSAAQTPSDAINEQPPASLINMPSGQSRTPHEVLDGIAKVVGRYAPSAKLRVVLGLNPPKMAEEEKFLKELQDPKSPNFQKYLTAEQWNARFAPSKQDEQAVVDWAESQGLTVTMRYPNRLIVDVEGTSETVEKAFGVTINSYQVGANTEFSNDRDPVIPANLAGIIQSVGGLNSIQRAHALHEGNARELSKDYVEGPVVSLGAAAQHDGNRQAFEEALKISEAKRSEQSQSLKGLAQDGPVSPSVTSGLIDPTDIYSSYGYDYGALQNLGHCCNPTHATAGTPPATSIAVATAYAFQGSDIAGFQSRYNYLAYHYQPIYVDGTPTCCNDETTLDTEWSIATANSFGSYIDTSEVFVYEGVNNLLSTFTDVYNAILNRNETRVFTTSWGCREFTCTGSGTMDTDHAIFNSMIGQGWTLMAATGDQGSAAGCSNAQAIQYPSSDPDIVAVGGTTLSLYSDGSLFSETGWQGATYSGACSQNNGGSTGGCSGKFAAPSWQTSPFCGSGSRSVPDISLNSGAGQNTYFDGSWYGFGGTSIASPMVAGFFAQANAYLTSLGLGYTTIGQGGPKIYYLAHNPTYASHVPFYDMTSGCNNNDITALYGLGYYCAVAGYDRVTGWGSYNALQLAWGMNAWWVGDFAAPTVAFSGPFSGNGSDHWYNTDQLVSWTITDNTTSGLTATGVSGFSQAWDTSFSDPNSEPHGGTGNSFYSGPQHPNATSGYMYLSSAGQGCHYATVDAWDNSGYTSGNQYYFYICYDTVAPVTTGSLSGTLNGSVYDTAVKVTLSATDATSGVAHTYYSVDGSGYAAYSGSFTISTLGSHTVRFYSVDTANNTETLKSVSFFIKSLTSTKLTSSLNPSRYLENITLTVKVTALLTGTPTGTVTFKNGATTLGTATLAGGVATLNVNSLSEGIHSLTASYSGASVFFATTSSALSQSVLKGQTKTTLTSSVNPSSFNQSVTFTATVVPSHGGTPTGIITFMNGSTSIGTGTLSGAKASLAVSSLAVGTHSVTAVYSGSGSYLISTSSAVSQVVNKAKTTTTLSSSLNPSTYGKSVTFTAAVVPSHGGTPTGTVTFKNGATTLGTGTLSGGKASLAVSSLAVGTHSVTAVYSGSGSYLISTSSAVSQVVNKAKTTTTLSSSLNPSTVGANVTFTAKVTAANGPTPVGSATFKNGTTTLGTVTLNSSGVATFSTKTLTAGTHSITGAYGGSATDLSSTSSALSQVVK